MKKLLIVCLLLLGAGFVYAQQEIAEYKIADRQKDGITLAKYVDGQEIARTAFPLSTEETDPFKIGFFPSFKEILSSDKQGRATHALNKNGEDLYYIYYDNKEQQEDTIVVKDGKMLRLESTTLVDRDYIIWELKFRKNGSIATLLAQMANFVMPTPTAVVYTYPVDESADAHCEMLFSVTIGKLTYKTKWNGPWEKVFAPGAQQEASAKGERLAKKMRVNTEKAHLEKQLYDWVLDWSDDILAHREKKTKQAEK